MIEIVTCCIRHPWPQPVRQIFHGLSIGRHQWAQLSSHVSGRSACIRGESKGIQEQGGDRAGPFASFKEPTLMNVAHVTRAIPPPPTRHGSDPLYFSQRDFNAWNPVYSFLFSLSLFLQMQRLKSALNLSNDLTGSKLQEQRSSLTKDFIALDKFRYVTSIRIGG